MTNDYGQQRNDSKNMAGVTRRVFLKYSIGTAGALGMSSLMLGCGGGSSNAPLIVFSDVHFNPYFDPAIVPALISSDVSQWESIFKSSKLQQPAAYGADTNYPLLVLALASISQNKGSSSLVVYTGDILSHYFPQYFYGYRNGTKSSQNDADTAAMIGFSNKTVQFFMGLVRAAVGSIPVMFALGNADSYTGYGPDSAFLTNTAELYYSQFLNGTTDHQQFLSSFQAGGYYAAEPLGVNAGLTVIGLNTIIFSPLVPGNNDAVVNTQLAWLDSQLAAATAAGNKVWLLMHVPPGADIGTTAQKAASNGQINATSATMMWRPAYQETFLQTIAKYPGTVTMTLAGHTHMDEFRIISPGNVLSVAPGVSPVFNNNSAYKVVTFSQNTFEPTDYAIVGCDISKPASAQFTNEYTFSAAYGATGLLNPSLEQLFPLLKTDSAKQASYRKNFYVGNNSLNPITNTNWPIYWYGIDKMTQQDLIDSVNAY